MKLVVMGVCGSGKTSVGETLSERLGIPFFDADDFHSAENKSKMAANIPLTDADRFPWLQRLSLLLEEETTCVLACSCLKRSYREILANNRKGSVRFVFLSGAKEVIQKRLDERKGHYMKTGLLQSQLDTLEAPDPTVENVIVVNIFCDLESVINQLLKELKNSSVTIL